jgi:hypothetical protein
MGPVSATFPFGFNSNIMSLARQHGIDAQSKRPAPPQTALANEQGIMQAAQKMGSDFDPRSVLAAFAQNTPESAAKSAGADPQILRADALSAFAKVANTQLTPSSAPSGAVSMPLSPKNGTHSGTKTVDASPAAKRNLGFGNQSTFPASFHSRRVHKGCNGAANTHSAAGRFVG